MTPLIGEYDCKVDNKGRVRFPSNLLKQLGKQIGVPFVINRGFGKYLNIYPKSSWDYYSTKVGKLGSFKKENLAFKRMFYKGATEVGLDSSDRILLTKRLLAFAEVEKDIILNAMDDRIELWAAHHYEAQIELEPSTGYMELAEKVFAEDSNEDKPEFRS